MLRKVIVSLTCGLFITINTNGQDYYYGNYGKNWNRRYVTSSADWSYPTGQFQTDYGNEKVTIQLFYEAHCPGCKQFDTGPFKQTVLELGPYLGISLHPYGNANTTVNAYGGYEFISQHGPEETYGNKLHACAIDVLQNMTMAVLFNSCMMDSSQAGNGSDDAAADVCGRSMWVNSEAIKRCAKNNKGSQLLKYHGDASKMAGIKTVPTVLVNGMPASLDNFKGDVCKAFRNPPPQCRL